MECHQEPGGPCSCLISSSALFTHGVAYSFQVAAQSVYGEGSFSDPVITNALGSQGIIHDINNVRIIMILCINALTTIFLQTLIVQSEVLNQVWTFRL